MEPHEPILLAGPTASGKSALALKLAKELGGEIISVDSMQVYRGLDIGTAKPSLEERAAVTHHLIDLAELTEAFDAAQFLRNALRAEQEIQSRGRLPIYCGGTGLYFKARLDGLGEAPGAEPTLRAELESTPLETLLEELRRIDPQTHAKIDLKNPRRVIRAVEVIRATGRPFSEQRAAWQPGGSANPAAASVRVFGLRRAPEDLRARIDRRVEEMFARGLVAETRALLERGLEKNRAAMQGIGYRQIVEHLRGERSLAETVALVKTRTWQFAKRQMTWFRRQLAVQWLDLAGEESERQAFEAIVRRVRQER